MGAYPSNVVLVLHAPRLVVVLQMEQVSIDCFKMLISLIFLPQHGLLAWLEVESVRTPLCRVCIVAVLTFCVFRKARHTSKSSTYLL